MCQSKLFQKGVGNGDQTLHESAPAPSSRALECCTTAGSWILVKVLGATRRISDALRASEHGAAMLPYWRATTG